MQTNPKVNFASSANQQPLTGLASILDEVRMEDSTNAPIDNELFIRKTFENDPIKGCDLLFRLYYRPLCSHAVRFVYSKEIAEDLVADVFYQFWDKQAYMSVKYSYRAYLFRSVRNRSVNYLANELKPQESLEVAAIQETSPADLPHAIMNFDELYHKVDELVALLPPQCRKVFILNRFEGKKSREIASDLGLSIRTVEMHLANALSTLRQGLSNQWLPVVILLVLLKGALY